MPNAVSLAEEIKRKTGLEAELIPGGGGIFDVEIDGEIVYSKFDTFRFPEDEEILEQISARSGA